MSKITDALTKAEQERASFGLAGKPVFSEHLHAFKQELHEQIRLAEGALTHQGQNVSAPSVAVDTPTLTGPAAIPTPPLSASHGSSARVAVAKENAASVSWDEAIGQAKRQLAECERQAARHAGEQARLQGQMTAAAQFIQDLEQERLVLRQRLEQLAQLTSSIETAKATWARRLEVLQGYQLLAHEAKMAEEELRANAALVEQMSQSQQRVAAELAHYQQRSQALEQRVTELKFQVAQALASTGMEATES